MDQESSPSSARRENREVLIPILADLGTDHRCCKIAASLRQMGYDPIVLCDRPLHPMGPAWEGIRVRILTRRSHYHGFLRAFLAFLWRLTPILASTRSRLWIVEDLPPLFWTALWGRLRGARVVYDAREIILETPMIRNRPSRRLAWGGWHAAGMALVDGMMAVSPLAVDYFRKRYPGKRVFLLPNAPAGAPGGNREDTPARAPVPGGLRLIYQGALRPGSGLREALAALALAPGHSLDIYGFGPEGDALRRQAEALGLGARVRLAGTVPFEALPPLIAAAHAGLHLLQPLCLSYDLTLSNKVFDYIHGETPMLLGPTSAHRDLIRRHPVGVVVPSLSAGDILAGLAALEAGWEGFRLACREAKRVWDWDAFRDGWAEWLAR